MAPYRSPWMNFFAARGRGGSGGMRKTDGFNAAEYYTGQRPIHLNLRRDHMRMNADMTAGIRPSGCAQAL